MTERKNHSPDSKAKVALDAIREQMTLDELSKKYSVHPTQIGTWKRAAIENMAAVFSPSGYPWMALYRDRTAVASTAISLLSAPITAVLVLARRWSYFPSNLIKALLIVATIISIFFAAFTISKLSILRKKCVMKLG